MSPVVDAEPLGSGPGWGCSCRAFRLGEPTPEQGLAALARAANVTVEDRGSVRKGTYRFVAWTDPEERYNVTFDSLSPGGWCKHIIACASHYYPWWRQVALGAGGALGEIKELRKELGNERRKRERLERKLDT